MKIKYESKRLKFNLWYGCLMIVIGIFGVINDAGSFLGYIWLFFGSLLVATYFYDKKYQYLTIEDGFLKKHFPITRSIKIDEIKKIRKYVNSYKVETENKSMRISKGLIETNSLIQLEQYFQSLNLKV